MFDLSLSNLLIIKEKIASYLRLYVHEKEKQAIYFFLFLFNIALVFVFNRTDYVFKICLQSMLTT